MVYSLASLSIINDEMDKFMNSGNTDVVKYSQSRQQFALLCGVWNGFVELVAGVPQGLSLVVKADEGLMNLITNKDNARAKLKEAFDKFSWSALGNMIDEEWKKATANPCMVSHLSGKVVFVVASCFIGAGEANIASKFLQTVERLDVIGQPEYKAFFNTNADAMYAYEQLYKAGRIGLKQNKKALEAFITAKNNAKLKELGFTDELLAKVNGYNPASYDEILTDLNKLGDFLTQNNIKLENFQSTIGILVGNNANYRQGVHWIIQDVGKETAFANKTLTLEVSINNARETFSFIDLVCKNCSVTGRNINIEYKSGPGSITKETIKKQFIERDLFNANSLDEIQWRMKNTDFDSDKLKSWLKEHKYSIDDIINGTNINVSNKFKNFFGMNSFSTNITDGNIDAFVNNNYTKIFK